MLKLYIKYLNKTFLVFMHDIIWFILFDHGNGEGLNLLTRQLQVFIDLQSIFVLLIDLVLFLCCLCKVI